MPPAGRNPDTTSHVAEQRLAVQRLRPPLKEGIEDVVRHFGAMQSQEFAVAKWSIAQRTTGVTAADIDRAFADGQLLRTHVLRPTWHFVSPLDLRWLMTATAPRVQAFNALYYRQSDLSPATLTKANRLLSKALEGVQLTRAELAVRLAKGGIKAEGLRLVCIMMNAELEQVICSGNVRGKQHTYALFDERVPRAKAMSREAACAELARRYFAGHGPASVRDFRWWSSLTAGEARTAIEAAGNALESREIEGRRYMVARSNAGPAKPTRALGVHLLQAYDEYVVAFTETKNVFSSDGHAGPRRSDGVQFIHAILIGTQVVGHWRRRAKGAKAEIEFYVNRALSKAEDNALQKAIRRYQAFANSDEGNP
jgi:hypothetical protein